ncbi:hypothetical protein KC19_3G151200 [Ceratodon purpureus]|uniref:DNA-binding protein BIN4 n=1 Tax=Ceratodon purpureus TaxID=3225 RepID=A0A8T0IIP6_CERPU|nr:hypothetical protein KC19_3G151200 [Ceratodon purpureus]
MEVRKSPRKAVMSRKSRESVVEIDGVEFAVSTEKKKVAVARKRKVVKDVSSDDDEEECEEEEDVKPLVKKSKKRLSGSFEFDEEDDDVKPVNKKSKTRFSGEFETEEEDDEERVPVSRKKGKVSLQESDHLDADMLSDGFEARNGGDEEEDVEMVKEEEDDGGLKEEDDDDMPLTQLSGFQTQDTEEGEPLETQEQERRIKPRAASTLPIVFGEKINKTKVLLECEGDAVDLSGDMGAVGRFTVDRRDNDLLMDLKGIIYKTTIVPSNTFFVVNVGQTEAKVEAIMSDFVQLREDTNFNENETMVEGTLQGFAFDSDEEFERPAVEKGASPEKIKHEEGADDGKETKKKKLPAKTPKSGKTPAKKAVAGKSKVGGKAKVKVGKKPTVKANKTKGSAGKK